ncbi:hypothetical protein COY26_02725 [Candidatus Woesearchaeota archaeon CG_4_10_14_0_2_um_filter_33_10]|nr:MAG: hypothetical protein COS79_04075 [Candidatus Woesearchaeota archaeon CG06_land_8_20_14_3_00_33_13]PIZ53168.1 MAG: hypothetical protein COY26_02725 [Candidatus Woesearchaeota archaeon CG_4_10_14_0_2_um_filter_33_10]
MVMEEGFSTEDDHYKIKSIYFNLVSEAYNLFYKVISPDSDYEKDSEIIDDLSDIIARHVHIRRDLNRIILELEPPPPEEIKKIISDAKNAKNIEAKIQLYEFAAESALLNVGIFKEKVYTKFGKSCYSKASDLWKELGFPTESNIDMVLSKKFEDYAIILNCMRASYMIYDSINELVEDFEDYKHSKSRDKTKILAEEPYLQQLKKFATDINIIKERKRKNLFEEKLMGYFDALRDAYMDKEYKFAELCISEIKKEVDKELGGNSISIFGWPKEQTKDNIARWINAYTGIEKLIKKYIPDNNVNN